MGKSIRSRIIRFGIAFSAIILSFFSACEIGLGAAVDTEAPSIDIVTPPVDSIVRNEFALKGTWDDDGSIEGVTVTLKRTDGYGTPAKYEATVTDVKGKKDWFVVLNSEESPILDGAYEATVEIADTAGHKLSQTRTFSIDNTPPLIILQRPGTKLNETPDAYGQTFSLNGMGADDNSIDHIDVEIFSDAACTNLLKKITKSNVPPTIELDVAVFEDGVANDYSEIYGSTSKNGTQNRYCKITAYDNAKSYPANSDEVDETGNKTSVYYLYDDIYTGILENHSAAEVYKMLSGTWIISGQGRSADKIDSVKALLAQHQMSESNFSLNPENNPLFIVNGKDNLTKNGSDFTGEDYNISTGTGVVVEVSTGLDGISLDAASLRPYLLPCDAYGNATVPNIPENRIYLAAAGSGTKSGTSYKFTVSLDSATPYGDGKTIIIGGKYIFGVEGHDQRGNTVIPKGGAYGFILTSNGAAPGLTVTSPANTISYVGLNGSQNFHGTLTCQDGAPSITITKVGTTTPVYSHSFDISDATSSNGILTYTFDYNLDFDGVTENSQNQYTITASQNALNTTVTKTVIYDKDAPDISITDDNISPIAKLYDSDKDNTVEQTGNYLNGKVKIKLTISDEFDAIDTETNKPYFEVIPADAVDTDDNAALPVVVTGTDSNTVGNKHYITKLINGNFTINTLSITDGTSIRFRIVAWDRAGNKKITKSSAFVVNQASDKPVVWPGDGLTFSRTSAATNGVPSSWATSNNRKAQIPSGVKLQFYVHDDDGIKEIKVWEKAANATDDPNNITFTPPTPGTDGDLRHSEIIGSATEINRQIDINTIAGTYWYKIEITDNVEDRESGDNNGTSTFGPFILKVTTAAPTILSVTAEESDSSDAAVGKYVSSATNAIKTKWKNKVVIESSEESFELWRAEVTIPADGSIPAVPAISESSPWVRVTPSLVNSKTIYDVITPSASSLTGDKGYYYYIKDLNGTTCTSAKYIKCLVDNTAPTITISSPGTGEESRTGINSINSSPYMFAGTITEANEISSIYYQILPITSNAPSVPAGNLMDSATWINSTAGWKSITPSSNWSFSRNMKTGSDFVAEGKYKIYMFAIDGAGNLSDANNSSAGNQPYSQEFHVDMEYPSITLTDTTPIQDSYLNKDSTNFTIEANVSDSNGIDSVIIARPVTFVNQPTGWPTNYYTNANCTTLATTFTSGNVYFYGLEATETATSGIYSKQFTIGSSDPSAVNYITDGNYTFTVTVKDRAGKTTSTTRRFTIDTIAPTISEVKINSVDLPADADNSSKWYRNQTIPLLVTAADTNGSGLSSVEYLTLTNSQTADDTTLADSNWTALSPQSGSYSGSAIFNGTGTGQKLYIRVKDKAGNIYYFNTNNNPVTVNIDTTKPVVGNTFFYQYQWTEQGATAPTTTAATATTGQIYVNGSKDLIVYGQAYDLESGLNSTTPLDFTIGGNPATPTSLLFATTEPASGSNMTSLEYDEAPSDRKTIKYWKATFAKTRIDSSDECGALTVKAVNGARDADNNGDATDAISISTITFDNTAPVPSNITFTSSNTNKQPYKSAETETALTYFVSNTGTTAPTFTINGIAADNCGLKDVTLTINGTSITRTSTGQTELSQWAFAGFGLATNTFVDEHTYTAELKVTDLADNVATKTINLKIDTTGPKAMHWADANNKDIYFRIGNADNGTVSDVGSKYAFGSWGNDSTIEIRGTFEDKTADGTDAAGLKRIHYAIFNGAPTDAQITALENGTLTTGDDVKVVKSFSPLETPESKKVPYSTNTSGGKASKTITSNFKTTLSGFESENNYLVLVAEDNAGNRKADALVITKATTAEGEISDTAPTNGTSNWNSENHNTATAYYSINKDTQAPNIWGPAQNSFYTNGTGDDISISGTANDALSGLAKVTVSVDEIYNNETSVPETVGTTTYTWTDSIPVFSFADESVTNGSSYTIYAKATDKAGVGNSKQISAGTITVDKENPAVSNLSMTVTTGSGTSAVTKTVYSKLEDSTTKYYLNNTDSGKTFKISGLATDNYGIANVSLDVETNPATAPATKLQTQTINNPTGTWEFTIGTETDNWTGWTTTNGATAKITVKDKAGNTKTETLNIVFDRTAPVVNLVNSSNSDEALLITPTATQTEASLFKFEGKAGCVSGTGSDTVTSGFDKVDLLFTTSSTNPGANAAAQATANVASDGSWSSTVDFTNSAFGTIFRNNNQDSQGTKYLWVRAYDNAGNVGAWVSKSFMYDKASPTISFTTKAGTTNPDGGSYRNSGFKLKVNATDTNGVQSVKVSYPGLSEPLDLTALTATGEEGNWEKEFKVGSETGSATLLDDGEYDFTITVTDNADKTNFVTRRITVDTTLTTTGTNFATNSFAPTGISIGSGTDAKTWYKSSSIKFAVNVTEPHVSTVQISKDNSTYETMSLIDGKYVATVSGLKEGENTIYVRIADLAGNNNNTNPIRTKVYVDSTAPTTLTAYDSTENMIDGTLLTNNSSDKEIFIATEDEIVRGKKITSESEPTGWPTGYYTDETLTTAVTAGTTYAANTYYEKDASTSTGIASVKLGNTDGELQTNGRYKITIPAASQTGNVSITVIDKAGNSASIRAFRFESDTVDPVVSISTPSATTIYGTKDITGTLTETNPRSVSLYYRTSAPTEDTTLSDWTLLKKLTKDSAPQTGAAANVTYGVQDSALYSWKVENVNFNTLSGATQTAAGYSKPIYFLAYAEDMAGRKSAIPATTYCTKNYTVDLDANRPVIQFTNGLELSSTMAAATRSNLPSRTLNGTVTDSEGVSKFEYKTDIIRGQSYSAQPADWPTGYYTSNACTTSATTFTAGTTYYKKTSGAYSEVPLVGGSFAITLNNDGPQNISFKVTTGTGANEEIFETSETETFSLNSPKIKDAKSTATTFGYSTSSKKATALFVKVDTQAPDVSSLEYAKAVPGTVSGTVIPGTWSTASETYGGERKQFYIRQFAYDDNGIVQSTSPAGTVTSETRLKIEKKTGDVDSGSGAVAGYASADTNYYYYALTKQSASTRTINGNQGTEWSSSVINTNGMATGSRKATIEIFDGTSSKKTEVVLVIDNTAPVISIKSPDSSQPSSGKVVASGETDLTNWENDSTDDVPTEFMYYALSLDNTTTPAADLEHRDSATAITSWKDENNATIETNPAGGTAAISYKPYYTPIVGGSFNWYVYFDDGTTGTNTHAPVLKKFLSEAGITTDTNITNKSFTTIVEAWLWIKAVDEVGNTKVEKQKVLIDPQGDIPTVTIEYPETSGTTLGGDVTLRGSAEDLNGTNIGVDSVWVQIISAKDNGYESNNTTGESTKTAGGLEFDETVTEKIEDTTTSYVHTYTLKSFAPTMKDVKQWINAADSNGNKLYEVYTNITAANPTRVSAVGTGAAWADNADGSAYYIRANYSGSSSWSLKINKSGEFNPATGKLNPIAYYIYAKDKDNYLSRPQKQLSVFDSDNPIISNLYLRQYTNNTAGTGTVTASRPYEEDMWVKDVWWLCGTVTDTDGLSTLQVGPEGSMTEQLSATESGTTQTKEFKYKLNSGDGVGNLAIKVEAFDNASTPHPEKKTYSINYDNTAPALVTTGSNYNISTTVKNSNGFYTFGSQVTENEVGGKGQSGFAYLAFWFERNITGYERIVYDVMRAKANSGVAYTGLSSEDGLMWKSVTVTRSADSLGTLTLSAADANIHAGGLCKVGGSIYFIKTVSGTTITLDGQPEYNHTSDTATETVKFAIANVVNKEVESGSGVKSYEDGKYGYYANMSGDDGDNMLESVAKQGTTWTWEANINSQNMNDGTVILHYVAFDKAGNSQPGQVTVNVANNAPRIASLEVWSDFNENGSKNEGESKTYYNLGRSRKIGGSTVTRATAVTDELVVSGNDKDYKLTGGNTEYGTSYMTVKASTRFIPELVGGNGALYYSYKYSDKDHLSSAPVHYDATSIGSGQYDGIDEEKDANGYYKLDDEGENAYIAGRTDLYASDYAGTKHYMEIPGKLESEPEGTYSLNALGNSSTSDPTWFEYTIYDSTDGCATWDSASTGTTGRLSAKFRVALNVQYQDITAPIVKIRPFYWNSLSDNSVDKPENPSSFQDLRGHIELKEDVTNEIKALTKGTTTYGNDDPKVSGVIKVEGYAYDDIKLKELWVKMAGHTNLASRTTAVSTYTTSGTWPETPYNATTGWGFKAEDVYCNGEGHLVRWTLTVDTAKRTDVADLDQFVTVYAVDARGSETSEHVANPTFPASQTSLTTYVWENVKGEPNALDTYFTDFYCSTKVTSSTPDSTVVYKAANRESMTPYYKMDIVPYITGISTSLDRVYEAKTSAFNRSATGAYPVRRGETVTVTGFNLKSGNTVPTVTIGNTSLSTTGTTSEIANSTVTGFTATLPNTLQSGDLTVTVSSIQTLNNLSKKTVEYNLEPNDLNNDVLTTARTFKVWSFVNVVSDKSVRYPTMRVAKNNAQTVAFAYDSGAQSYKMYLSDTLTTGKDFVTDYSFSQWYDTGVAVDTSGRIYGISQNGDSGGTGEQYYYTDTGHANSYFYAWNTKNNPGTVSIYSQNYDSYIDRTDPDGRSYSAYSKGKKKRAIENAYDGSTFNSQRVVSPKIVTGASGAAYVAYFDSSSEQVRFRYGTVTGSEYDSGFTGALVNHDNSNSGSATGYQVVAGKTSNSTPTNASGNNVGQAGEYVALGVVPSTVASGNGTAGTAVVAWYDASGQRLLLSYNTNPTANNSSAQWGRNVKVIDTNCAGWYVDLVIDPEGGIHIAYYDSSVGDLKYAYLQNYSSNPQVCKVDSYMSVGTNISIEVPTAKENILTANGGTASRYVPRISYFMSSYTKTSFSVRTAWPYKLGTDGKFANGVLSDKFTGNWEVMTVPTSANPLDFTVGVGIKKNDNNADSVLLGYGTKDGLQTATLQ